jgi:hypothetical protein
VVWMWNAGHNSQGSVEELIHIDKWTTLSDLSVGSAICKVRCSALTCPEAVSYCSFMCGKLM